jgi:hypothetical protein
MAEPVAVRMATTGYKVEMDVVGRFLKDYCEVHPNFTIGVTPLYETFVEVTQTHRISRTAFNDAVRQHGEFATHDSEGKPYRGSTGSYYWVGLRLRASGS